MLLKFLLLSFELGLFNFFLLFGVVGNLKIEDLFENRLFSLIIGLFKERIFSVDVSVNIFFVVVFREFLVLVFCVVLVVYE